ncbi:MAG: ywiE [Cyanobacteria bacterium RYN_339]|nr:ywiE [Cyanobacteria bacterium RYN_339]
MRFKLPLAALTSLLVTACGHGTALTGTGLPTGNLAAQGADAPPAFPAPEFSGGDVDMLYDMATFDAMEKLVAKATRSIKLDYYIFGGPTADRLANALIAKRKAGLDVRVMLDSAFGKIPEMRGQCLPVYEKLKAGGVSVLVHSVAPLPPKVKGDTIDHNKYFVIDESEALVGSMNLAKKFYNYHDLMMHVTGPVARDLARQHDFDWWYAAHPQAKAPGLLVHAVPASGLFGRLGGDQSQVRMIGTGLGHQTGFEALKPLLAGAKHSIHLQMHELGPGPVLDALIAARGRGVDVKILLDPGNVDPFVPVIHLAPKGVVNAVALDALLTAKMDVRQYHVGDDFTTAHMKIAVIDGETVFAGSINWTKGGFETVAETNLEVHGGRAPAQAEAQFLKDWNGRSDKAQPPSAIALQLCKLYQGMENVPEEPTL